MESYDKETYTEAHEAADLRQKISAYTRGAVVHGNVDRDWANNWLIRLGAEPVIASAHYRINIPITGNYGATVTASTRAEALAKFSEYVNKVAAAGQITDTVCHEGVYEVTIMDADPTFFSGPADPPTVGNDSVPGLDGLKDGIRAMLKEGVTEQGWGYNYAVQALNLMDLPALPERTTRVVDVPVSGTARIGVTVFEGDGDDVVQQAVRRAVTVSKSLYVTPDEIGWASVPGSGAEGDMGLRLVNDDAQDEDEDAGEYDHYDVP